MIDLFCSINVFQAIKTYGMKKIFMAIVSLISIGNVVACDICGCGVGNSYIGILPDYQKRIFGLRYRHNSVLTHVGIGGTYTYLTTKETYNTVEAWGGWNITDKFRLMSSVPYSFNSRENGGATASKDGIGDISMSAFYQLINNRKTITEKLLVQSLWIGGGMKFATGKYNPLDKNSTNDNANLFQLGTGSTDFNVGFMYDIRLQDMGINLSSNYKLTTENKYKYQYGNKFNVNAQTYYKFRIKDKVTVAPNAGLQYERSGYDSDKEIQVSASGGNLWLGTTGVEVAFKKFALGGNFQSPISQNLANGIVRAKNRLMVHVSFPF